MHYFIGDLGHLFVITAFVTALVTAFSYFKAVYANDIKREGWLKNGRVAYYIHSVSVLGIVTTLYIIIYNNYFEYHYAWAHSSIHLPFYYMLSAFWEGQEGSFLLWMFWHVILGILIINTNKYWEAPVMTIFALVQGFLASMILGVIILDLKIGSTPFILLRDSLNDPIFQTNPDFVPSDGNGLNPLLQNYWMVIHPPTLFLGFAGTVIPFAFCTAGLWTKKYTEWIKPALPWTLFSAAILGLGVMMGAYWAYETLNFGGYWNWDPVENAVFVPWLFLMASMHTMLTSRKSSTSLKTTIILVIIAYSMILYSTFLTRSGILGEASVHSFTDLGLSGQLLIYLFFFIAVSVIFAAKEWKNIPSTGKEINAYNREFWILTGCVVLSLMGLQVIIPTSIPVYNSIIEFFGGSSNVAPPADQVTFYSRFQIWFGVALAIISGIGQIFWWKKVNPKNLFNKFSGLVLITLLVSSVLILITGVKDAAYIVLLTAGTYTIVANGHIMMGVFRRRFKLTGGSLAHLGIGMMLIGIMFSSGYSRIITSNNTGVPIDNSGSQAFESENVRLFIDEPVDMGNYELLYKGQRVKARGLGGYFNKSDFLPTPDPYYKVAREDIVSSNGAKIAKGDTVKINPENTYYEVDYISDNGRKFILYPRIQQNEQMGGIIPSPDIKIYAGKDLYTHVNGIPDPEVENEWSETSEVRVPVGKKFFVKDYVSYIEEIEPLKNTEHAEIGSFDVGIKAKIKVLGRSREFYAEPLFIIKDMHVGSLPSSIEELGIKFSVLNVHPESDEFTLGINTTNKDYIILKAIEMPLINILWSGTILTLIGFGIAISRRYKDFKLLRDKQG